MLLYSNQPLQDTHLQTPVTFCIFNRPELTARVFEKISDARPPKLLIVADGPRPEFPDDNSNCHETRKIVENIDWECDVFRNYADTNMGCKHRIASGLDWVFEQCDEAIILEDDTVPNFTFFKFCETLLKKYKDDERVMMISGDNFQDGIRRGEPSYYFSVHAHIWGWATWRRAWSKYDVNMVDFPEFKKTRRIHSIFKDKAIRKHWLSLFESTYKGRINTWDFQWAYTLFRENGLSVIPNVNLVSNIGIGADATHTRSSHKYANLSTYEIAELIHPERVEINKEADLYFSRRLNSGRRSAIEKSIKRLSAFLRRRCCGV